MLDEQLERFRSEMSAPWDHLRERRVLREIERRLEERGARRRARRRAAVVAIPVSLSFAALAVAYFMGVDSGKTRAVVAPPVAVLKSGATGDAATAPERGGAVFEVVDSRVLGDGTVLELSRGAHVELRAESVKRVEIAQSEGRVRYRVTPQGGRPFVVVARGVLVQVKGTVFVVAVDGGKVSVKVERGLVHVAAKSGDVELGVGDELNTSADEGTQVEGPADAAPPPDPVPRPRASRGEGTSTGAAGAAASVGALLDRADAERRSGDLDSAAATLHLVVGRYPNDPRGPLAWFTLGKVERARDRAAVSAKAFHTAFSLAPAGPLGEDALAEEAAAWSASGDVAEARASAEQYLRRFPNGTHAIRMQRILE
jgi:transmembrane sensor